MIGAILPSALTDHCILECDHSGLKYIFEDHKIMLIIPEGAVPVEQMIHIEIGVVMNGLFVFLENVQLIPDLFVFPNNTRPISPIVWVCLQEKDVQLKEPFKLILTHFLTGLTEDELHDHKVCFAKAVHDDSPVNGGMKYVFNPCDSKPHFGSSEGYGYAMLESDHCCFYCLQADQSPKLIKDAGYCLTRIERKVSQRDEVFFTATFLLQTCITVNWHSIRYVH